MQGMVPATKLSSDINANGVKNRDTTLHLLLLAVSENKKADSYKSTSIHAGNIAHREIA